MLTIGRQSPVLNITLGADLLVAILDRHGVEGWNRWIEDMVVGHHMPLSWLPTEREPPMWLWIETDDGDLAGRNMDGADLRLVLLRRTTLENTSLIGASFGACQFTSFRGADLRDASFCSAEITGCNFISARLDGVLLSGAVYCEDSPPVGLPSDLFVVCRPETRPEFTGSGDPMVPVAVKANLTATRF